jgi:hypothetical protein
VHVNREERIPSIPFLLLSIGLTEKVAQEGLVPTKREKMGMEDND